MSLDSLAKCFISQIQDVTDNGRFKVGECFVLRVWVQGVVIARLPGSVLIVDDGSGVLAVESNNVSADIVGELAVGSYVQAIGSLGLRHRYEATGEYVRLLSQSLIVTLPDADQESLWWLEVVDAQISR